ncbi:MAG: hypothetical protein ACREOO_33015 [bacterium]
MRNYDPDVFFFTRLTVLLAVFKASFGLAQAPTLGNWEDYVAGEYDIQPNITYATANNTELKLDLYLPRDRSAPKPVTIRGAKHGGFSRQEFLNSFAVIRESLRKNGVLTKE